MCVGGREGESKSVEQNRPGRSAARSTPPTSAGPTTKAVPRGDSAASGRTYYRTIQVDLSGETGKKTKDIISEVFHALAMRVKVRHAPEEGSAVAGLIAELRELDNLHFEDDL